MIYQQRRADIHTVYALIQADQAELSIQAMYHQLHVSTSAYYAWRGCAPSQRAMANTMLAG